jgi:hypothetical protein
MLDSKKCYCPYCGEPIEVIIDTSEPFQEYTEDCFVCCRPIIMTVSIDETIITLNVRSEDE